MKKPSIVRAVTGTLAASIVAVVLLVGGGAAQAAEPVHTAVTSSVVLAADSCSANGVVKTTVAGKTECAYFDPSLSSNLTATRWADATSKIVSDYSGHIWSGLQNTTRTATAGMGMGLGNLFFQVAQSLVAWGTSFDPIKLLGGPIDVIAAKVGSIVVGGSATTMSIGVAIVIAGLLAAFFQARRSGNGAMWKRFGSIAVLFGLISVMVGGAGLTTGSGSSLKPGFGSPTWIASETAQIGSQLGSVPAAQLLQHDSTITDVAAASGTGCNTYLANLEKAYDKGYQSAFSRSFDEGSPAQIVSGLYTDSAVLVWKSAQLGNDPISSSSQATYGDEVFCHLLDWNASATPRQQVIATFGDSSLLDNSTPSGAGATVGGWLSRIGITTDLGLSPDAQLNIQSAAWGLETDSDDHTAASAVAWAACDVREKSGVITVTVRPAWDGVHGISDDACTTWWRSSASSKTIAPFQISDDDIADVFKDSKDTNTQGVAAAAQFVSDLHDGGNASSSAPWAYALSALVIMIAFGGLGIGLLIAKILSVISTLALIAVALKEIAAPDGGTLKWVKSYAATNLAVFGATMILAVIATITAGLVQAGPQLAAPGSTGSLIWIAMSPAIAVGVVVALMKATRVGNLFKPSGHLQWAAPALAGMVGAQKLLERGENKAANAAKGAAQNLGQSVMPGKSSQGRPVKAKASMGDTLPKPENDEPKPTPTPEPTPTPTPSPQPRPTPKPRPRPKPAPGPQSGPRDANGSFAMPGGGKDHNGAYPMRPARPAAPATSEKAPATPAERAAAVAQQNADAPKVAEAADASREKVQAWDCRFNGV
ncbi:hypothetical protein [Gryllotalpicola kribbensis]